MNYRPGTTGHGTLRKPSTGLKPFSVFHPGGALKEVETLRKPSTGLKRPVRPLCCDRKRGSSDALVETLEKTQQGIERCWYA